MRLSKNHMYLCKPSLVGRDALIAAIVAGLGTERLVTLTGPGGVGKTSIARHLAAHFGISEAFPDGVCWVDLAAVSDPTVLSQTVASAYGLGEQRNMPWEEALSAQLRSRQVLLVLDNCEHLRVACAALSAHLLAECPPLHILATSREPLGLPDEMRIAVAPLDPTAAVALFEVCATTHLPSFALTATTTATVGTICTQLDGVPLAIELAAARVNLLSVSQIADRMAQSLSLLSGGAANRPPRQRSLRAVLDWSYGLLDDDAQRLLAQLAVFAGSCDFAAVEAVCRVGTPLDSLAALVDTSLVMVAHHASTVRYHLHAVVRQYAVERLHERGETAEIQTRHLAWVIALAERAEAEFAPASQDAWLARLTLEHENIRSALQTAADRGDGDSLLRIAGAIQHFWNSVSPSEGRAWLARGLAQASGQPGLVSTKAWNAESFLAYRQGDYAAMHAAAAVALEQALQGEDSQGIAAAHYRLGIYAEMKGESVTAHEHYTYSLELFTELSDRRAMSQVLNGLAHVATLEGHVAEARQHYRQGLALARADNDHLTTALLLISLANLMLDEGALDAAEAAYAESLSHLRAINNSSYILYAVNGLGEVAYYRQQFAAATAHYDEGLRSARTLGLKDMEAQFLCHLGRTAVRHGNYAEAARCLSEALRMYLLLARTMRTAGTIHFCADLVFRLGYPAQAATLFVAGLRAAQVADFAYLGSDSPALLTCFRAAQAALDPAEYALAAADGAALTLEDAADLALSAVFLPQRALPAEAPPELRIFLFGQLRVVRDGRELTRDDWVYAKTKDLLLLLLLVDSASKADLAAALWPDASVEQIRQNFRMAIYHLRRALGRAEWIAFTNGRYAFNRTLSSWIDVAAFEHAVDLAMSDPVQRLKHLRTAASLYTGDLALGELESDLPLIRREQLHRQAIAALLALGTLHSEHQHDGQAADSFRRALALDRYSEAAHRGLLRSLARQGESAAALVHYDQLVEFLAAELGITPAIETATLAAQIKAGTPV
jgi:predicted ATPase/DNA-binding SARP family transcriptional activator